MRRCADCNYLMRKPGRMSRCELCIAKTQRAVEERARSLTLFLLMMIVANPEEYAHMPERNPNRDVA